MILAQSLDVVDCAGISGRVISGFSNEGTNCPSFDAPDSTLAAQLKEVFVAGLVASQQLTNFFAYVALMYAEN